MTCMWLWAPHQSSSDFSTTPEGPQAHLIYTLLLELSDVRNDGHGNVLQLARGGSQHLNPL
eukprot:15468502-Alexandrium_andersonii.AAC.1